MKSTRDISSKEDIKILIDAFYSRAMQDEVIGKFFTEVVQINMDEHMSIMYQFWEAVLFGSSDYRCDPLAKHIALDSKEPMERHHFVQWLNLFKHTVDSLYVGLIADKAKVRATSIATMMQIKIGQIRA